jgi:hypothetical protein
MKEPDGRISGADGDPPRLGRRGVLKAVAVWAVGASVTVLVLDRVFAAEPRGFDVALEGGKLSAGPKVIRVSEGETVEIRWTTDAPAEVHLHGYDIEIQVAPGAAATMTFKAFATGRFPITLHGSGGHGHAYGTLLYLEVLPR